MRRVGRPPLGGAARQLIAIRVDPDVLERFRKEARRRKVGYQTLINEVLAEHARPAFALRATAARQAKGCRMIHLVMADQELMWSFSRAVGHA